MSYHRRGFRGVGDLMGFLLPPFFGRMAEWLGNGLQHHLQRFESAYDLYLIIVELLNIKEMEANQTKTCPKCGRTLSVDNFYTSKNTKDGFRTYCKECCNKQTQLNRIKKITTTPNPALAEFTPQELVSELRARGYTGSLSYTEIKVHKILL